MTPLREDHFLFLVALARLPEMPCSEIPKHIEGKYVPTVVRRGYAEWIRKDNNPCKPATAIRITEKGRDLLDEAAAATSVNH